MRISYIHDVHARLSWVRHAAINPDLSFHDKSFLSFVYIYCNGDYNNIFPSSFTSPIIHAIKEDFSKAEACLSFNARVASSKHVRAFLNYSKTDWFCRMSLPIAKVYIYSIHIWSDGF